MSNPVQDNLAAVRRRMEEVQEFANAVSVQTYDPVDQNMVLELIGNIQELRALANSAKVEIENICAYLGLQKEW